MSDPTVVSIVIVAWRVRRLLRACLRSVVAQMQLPANRYEILVVDNRSDDGSVEMVRREFPTVRLLANEDNVGFAKANNQALPLGRGRYVLLLNPDTVVLDHALDRMVDYLEAHPSVGALGCRLLNADGSFQRWTGGAFPTLWNVACHFLFLNRLLPARLHGPTLFLEQDVPGAVRVDWVSGACMALRRSALGRVIFNEAFFLYGEDMELCARMARAGWEVVYTSSATVIHHRGRSTNQQSSDLRLTALKGPRAFYALQHGRSGIWLYDALTAMGFLLRWAAFSVLSLLRVRRAQSAERALASRDYFARALRVMAGR